MLHPFASWPYFGSGSISRVKTLGTDHLALSSELWKYENNHFIRQSDLPFSLYKAVAFKTEGKLFVIGGQNTNRQYENRIYQYTEATDQWQIVATTPISIDSDLPNFSYQDKSYIIDTTGLVYQFSATDLSWSIITKYPSGTGRRGIACVIKDNVYVGVYLNRNDVWQYNISRNKWIQKRGLRGDFRNVNLAYWNFEGNIYLLRGKLGSDPVNNLLIEFKPDDF